MSEASNAGETSSERPGRMRTWWHPLLARLLNWILGDWYEVVDEVVVGRMPLRLDLLLLRRVGGELSEEARRELPTLSPHLNRLTLFEFKSPTDVLEAGDLDQFFGLAHLFRSQQTPIPLRHEMTLIILAPQITSPFRDDVERSGMTILEEGPGVHRLESGFFETWIVETDRVAGPGEPILTLFSRVFLRDARHIIEEWKQIGYEDVLYYVLQQIQQFQRSGESFLLQHQGSEAMIQTLDELKAAVLAEIPPEERLRGLPPEELVRGLPPEDRVRGLSPEDRLRGLPPEDRLRGLPPEDRLRGLPPEDRLRGLNAEELKRVIELAQGQLPESEN
jgi:hypothetical protein